MAAKKRPAAKKKKRTLTAKQLAQRRYAARMRGVRARAKTAKKGRGRIKHRSAATTMRRKMGLKPGR